MPASTASSPAIAADTNSSANTLNWPPDIEPGPWAWYDLGGVDYLCGDHGRREVVLGPECRTTRGKRAGNVPAYHVTSIDGRLSRLRTQSSLGRLLEFLPDLVQALQQIAAIPLVCGDHDSFVRGLVAAQGIAADALRRAGGSTLVPSQEPAQP
jgi:hypothetical protein